MESKRRRNFWRRRVLVRVLQTFRKALYFGFIALLQAILGNFVGILKTGF
jgi:hypothetical protein